MRRVGLPPRSIPKTWNLTLDEPALTTRIVSMASGCRQCRDAPARIGVKDRGRTRRHPAAHGIGARCQDNGHARTEHDPGRIGAAEENEGLGEHVAGFQVWNDKDLCAPATGDCIPLIRAASGSIALSKASGPSRIPPVICPLSAILQSAAASMVDGILEVTVSTAERIATRGVPRPTWVKRSIAF